MNETLLIRRNYYDCDDSFGQCPKKGNTATVLERVEKELLDMGHEVNQVYLNNKTINSCLGCCACHKYPDEIACVHQDDAIQVLEQMIASDAILLASPIYFWSFTAQMKALIDRSYALVTNYQRPEHNSLLKGIRVGLLVTGGDSYEDNAEEMFKVHGRFVDFLCAEQAGELYVGDWVESAGLGVDVQRLAESLVS